MYIASGGHFRIKKILWYFSLTNCPPMSPDISANFQVKDLQRRRNFFAKLYMTVTKNYFVFACQDFW